jgi:long-chain acyl-CoA synthetase
MNSIIQELDKQVKLRADKKLLLLTNKEYTYSEFDIFTKSIMQTVLERNYSRGDKVAIVIETHDCFYASLFALWNIGAVAVPLNAGLSSKDLLFLIEKSGCDIVLTTADYAEGLDVKTKIIINDEQTRELNLDYKPLENSEQAVIMYTSGTTGIPKGVVQTMYSQSKNAALTCKQLGLTKDDRIYINTPPYFTSGLSHFTTVINAGGSLVGYKGFVFGKDLLKRMEDSNSTGFGGAPAHLIRVVETLEEPYRNTKINFWMSSGDHLPKSAIEKAEKYLPDVRLFNVYGLTEVSGRLCILKPEFAIEKHGSVGYPIGDMEVLSVGEDGEPVNSNEIGEIHTNGDLLFNEYLDSPDLTKKAKTKFGFKTGDFGYVDSDGFVFIEGRKDDIFKRGGEKVSTNKIKQAMLSIGIFKDVAVVAKEDEIMGKVPVACVVMKDDIQFSKFKIIKVLRDRLVATHIPANIISLDEIPRTGSGKAKIQELIKIVSK